MVVVSNVPPTPPPPPPKKNPRDVEYKQSDSVDVLNVDFTLSDEWKVEWLTIYYFVHQLAVS